MVQAERDAGPEIEYGVNMRAVARIDSRMIEER